MRVLQKDDAGRTTRNGAGTQCNSRRAHVVVRAHPSSPSTFLRVALADDDDAAMPTTETTRAKRASGIKKKSEPDEHQRRGFALTAELSAASIANTKPGSGSALGHWQRTTD